VTDYDLDPVVRPQDDLFRYVNGPWLATAEIAEDRSSAGAFITLVDEAEVAVRDIVQGLAGSAPGTTAAAIERLCGSFMDTEAVDAAGLEPLRPLLAEIDAIETTDDLLAYFGRSVRRGTGSPVDLEVEVDPGEPTRYVLFASQGGLGLPDEEYYRLPEHADVLAAYRDHVDRTLATANISASASSVVVGLETDIAAHHWDKVRTRDLVAAHNPMPEDQWASAGADWRILLRAAGVPGQDTIEVAQPSFFDGLAGLITKSRLDDWRAWARWALLSNLSPYLPEPFVRARFDFYGTVLQGIPSLKPRWKRGVDLVERLLGEPVGKLYVERHFPASSKARMTELVGDLIAAYRASIESLDWMRESTRAEALEKLAKFTPKIGYPDVWKSYDSLTLADGLIDNVLAATEFLVNDELSKLGGPIRRWEWFMTPQTVNAYYHPLRNEIVFPAAILQPPFFSPDATDAANYGAIGAVIGHEIGHGFDDQGSTADGDGRLRDWWTADDRAAFEARTASLVEQYSALSPAQLPDICVNGELTLGENIGDLGGLGIAHDAWLLACERGDHEPGDVQEFFRSWALTWQTKRRDEALRQQVATDPHSPDEFRCNQVVRNLDAFYDAFDVHDTDALWLDPAQRVTIW